MIAPFNCLFFFDAINPLDQAWKHNIAKIFLVSATANSLHLPLFVLLLLQRSRREKLLIKFNILRNAIASS